MAARSTVSELNAKSAGPVFSTRGLSTNNEKNGNKKTFIFTIVSSLYMYPVHIQNIKQSETTQIVRKSLS